MSRLINTQEEFTYGGMNWSPRNSRASARDFRARLYMYFKRASERMLQRRLRLDIIFILFSLDFFTLVVHSARATYSREKTNPPRAIGSLIRAFKADVTSTFRARARGYSHGETRGRSTAAKTMLGATHDVRNSPPLLRHVAATLDHHRY